MSDELALRAHRDWLGYVQPEGLVVTPKALFDAQAQVEQNVAERQVKFRGLVEEVRLTPNDPGQMAVRDIPSLITDFWEWKREDLVGLENPAAIPERLSVVLPEYGETLRPTFCVGSHNPGPKGEKEWIALFKTLDVAADLDADEDSGDRRWRASPQAKFERLLRETKIPIGVLTNRRAIRLVYAPSGESSGHITFPVDAMCEVDGRPILAAFHMLFEAARWFILPEEQRLPAILRNSRKFQNDVSEKLAKQVLGALYELLRGFQSAHDASGRVLLEETLKKDPNHIYAGLLTTLLRLIFILYAEDRDLLSTDPLYTNNYSIAGLFDRLRADDDHYHDTMDQRYGAWAGILALFRMIYDGAKHGDFHLPQRHGDLLDADKYPFLEGRPYGSLRAPGSRIEPPLVSDGVVYRVLSKLLILDGERLSYRALDVEQIGSVYETMMGFELGVAAGRSIAIKATKSGGAPVTVNLDELLAEPPKERAKKLKGLAGQDVSGDPKKKLEEASSPEAIVEALEKKVAKIATPQIISTGAMVLQPSDERRKSGSHYTPRSLTEPIVRTALRPIFERMGEKPTPEQLLDLKVCDIAVGSGAFLVEACRQLGDELVKAWRNHRKMPVIPPDEDEVLHARRLVAQRCLYGVDKNPLAVDLAKLSLWLVTLAKEHRFTFVDHALKHGDSLVGLTRKQIENFHWEESGQIETITILIKKQVGAVLKLRTEIEESKEGVSENELRLKLKNADEALGRARLIGDLAVGVFFDADKARVRQDLRERLLRKVESDLSDGKGFNELLVLSQELSNGSRGIAPFHWDIEFPEVFERVNPGFDAIVGNPPFLGGSRISEVAGRVYFQWLVTFYPPCQHQCDLVAFFFRRCYALLRDKGCLGLIATKTLAQGDAREGGLRTILSHQGQIYSATLRYKWPGQAAVTVCIVHIAKKLGVTPILLDGKPVSRISAYLNAGAVDDSPAKLSSNPYFSKGSQIYGRGFLFADDDLAASPLSEMQRILSAHPDWESRILPYVGGEEICADPGQLPDRYAIYLSDVENESKLDQWPELKAIIEAKVKPERLKLGNNPNNTPLKKKWWAYQAHRPELQRLIQSLSRVLVISGISTHRSFAFHSTRAIFSNNVVVIARDDFAAFCVLQSRVHELWSSFTSSTLEDRLGYRPSDSFETFPFPRDFDKNGEIAKTGEAYYAFRASKMINNNEGLTKTYNRFHDPHERDPDILKLRALHSAMDRVVLDAYGFTDISTDCRFLLNYEIAEEDWGDKKKPYRYRWSDETRDEVLTRLLALNAKKAEEERVADAAATPPPKPKQPSRKRKNNDFATPEML